MNKPQIFNFHGQQIRTIDKDGQPWFVLTDVCSVLEIGNPSQVKVRLDDGVISNEGIPDALGRTQRATIINEDGLYDVILESRKPEARAFRKWVTSEVLPTIRQHGAYMTPAKIEEVLLNPDTIIDLAQRLKQANEDRAMLTQKIEADRPKVLFADAVATSKTNILVGELAKILKQNGVEIGQNRLFAWLRENGYLISRRGTDYNMPTQRSMELGLFEIKETSISHSDGHVTINKTPKVTGKGQVYFINKFKSEQKLA
ncbi:phage antirepressor KilAC domain-containing protein [Paenibacillus macerans]|uniref:phage antirepressor n=1 Tax=Paenibacillus macerans TaxID=44252 RepID=UPI002DB6F0FF|nr:phage antirepressor KilAC domain-containing protein [Paenibacillus macerans]MEC0140769.1 phage antirepressor KilAC domain-containing protein [Paenibacillus macerans]